MGLGDLSRRGWLGPVGDGCECYAARMTQLRKSSQTPRHPHSARLIGSIFVILTSMFFQVCSVTSHSPIAIPLLTLEARAVHDSLSDTERHAAAVRDTRVSPVLQPLSSRGPNEWHVARAADAGLCPSRSAEASASDPSWHPHTWV